MIMKSQSVLFVSLIIVLLGIGVTVVTGLWSTQSDKTPRRYEKDQTQFENQYDPADIRGSYTFSEISTLYDIPMEDLAAAFAVEENKAAGFKCKDLETIYEGSPQEIGTGSVKMFVAFYGGLPFDLTSKDYLPAAAAAVLHEKGNMTEEQLSYMEGHILDIP